MTAKAAGIESTAKANIGDDDRDDHEQQWCAVATARFADEQPAAAEAVRDRDGAPDEPQHRVRGWVGLLRGATESAIGDIEEQGAERVDDGFHALDQRYSGGDCNGAEHERAGDADDDHAAAQLRRHEEVREQEREEEHVVERERALDQVNRRPFADRAARQRDSDRHCESKQQPADAPEDRLPTPGLPAGRE